MLTCPKCRNINVSNPTYCKDTYGREMLRYHCSRCHYSQDESCADAGVNQYTLEEINKQIKAGK